MEKKKKRRVKRAAIIGPVVVCILIAASLVIIPYSTSGPSSYSLRDSDSSAIAPQFRPTSDNDSLLKVMTLNIAHGRATSRHQALLKRDKIQSNLDQIAKMLVREQPHIVALQEADRPSLWSGRFDHVQYLADSAGFSHQFCGEHVKGLKTRYGTAFLSHVPLNNCAAITFAPSPPTLSKGFVVSHVTWPGEPNVGVTVVSAHLDFARATVRKAQVERMISTLSEHHRPLIIMGDFNCQWTGDEASLRRLAEDLGTRAYHPTATNMATYPSFGKRLDWILVSPELQFVSYRTITDPVSDHYGVVASLKLVRRR